MRADLRPRFDGRSLEALLHGGTLRVWCVGEDGTWSDPAVAHEVRELGDEGLRVDRAPSSMVTWCSITVWLPMLTLSPMVLVSRRSTPWPHWKPLPMVLPA